MPPLRVLFVHGLESSPQGTKARLFAEHFEASTPAMDTRDFEGCVARQAEAIARFSPDVVVGSSFGGAVVVALLQRGLWRGPTLLLAPAALRQGLPAKLPPDVPVWIVHGTRDAVVPLGDSHALARAGSPDLVRLLEVDDDHPLHGLVRDGRLVGLVRELAASARAPRRGFVRHFTVFFEEPALWPVTAVVAAHGVLFGGLLLLYAVRDRNGFALLALAGTLVASVDAAWRELRRGRFGLAARALTVLWAASALAAWLAARFQVI